MGFESRDYSRDGSYSNSFTSFAVEFPPVVKWLLIANAIVFLLQIFILKPASPSADGFPATIRESVVQEWFELSPSKTVYEGQVWRLLTSAFCHDRLGIWHLVFNMLLLFWFGRKLELTLGSKEFLCFYLVGALASSLAYIALAFYIDKDIPAIGASGAVMAVMMLYTLDHPHETILLFFIIPVPLWLLLGIYVIFDLHPVLLMLAGDTVNTGVAHAGHLGGLLFGFLYWRFSWRLTGMRLPKPPRARPKIRLYEPPPEEEPADDLSARVDEILKKISERGQDSLTAREKEILQQASRKYRGRK